MTSAINTDRVIIVGAGLGAIYAALNLAPRPVLMISPAPLGEGASSAWAQGGVAAAMNQPDTSGSHAIDTIRAGAGIVDQNVAERVTQEAKAHVLNLTAMGTPFDRDESGQYVLSREAAHSYARVVRVGGDQAGAKIMQALVQEVQKHPSIQIVEGAMASRLEVEGDKATGIWIEAAEGKGSDPILLKGPAILLAGGGSGGLYEVTTNPPRIRGQVIGLAARAGAMISDAEFVQFHPTAINVGADPAPLATEALRGEGAILLNNKGERFMESIHPDAELAPRDIVARAIFDQNIKGLAPALDTRKAIGDKIVEDFPSVTEACRKAGIDPVKDPIPVATAAHYHMGGIDTSLKGRASLNNLWVCGEASSTGLHGANRLASNGLLEALVFARICADDIHENLDESTPEPESSSLPAVEIAFDGQAAPIQAEALKALRATMARHVGVVRNAQGLKTALAQIEALEQSANPSCSAFLNMTATATLIAASALKREESRGGHYREDFPDAIDTLANRSHMTWQEALQIRQEASLEMTQS